MMIPAKRRMKIRGFKGEALRVWGWSAIIYSIYQKRRDSARK
jgi:hypothetical protein